MLTLTGNLVIAVPQHVTQYTLRPYFVAGGGLMRARSELFLDPLPVASALPQSTRWSDRRNSMDSIPNAISARS